MFPTLQRLIRQGGIYALGNALVKVAGLLLAPLYLNPVYLLPAHYGYLILLEVTAQVAILLGGLGVASGLLKYLSDASYREEHAALPFTAWVVAGAGAILMGSLFWISAPVIRDGLLSEEVALRVVRLLGGYVVLKIIASVPYMVLRVKERAEWYVVGVALEMLVLIGGVYYLLAVRRMGLEGVMMAYIASAGSSALLFSVALLKQVRWQFQKRWARQLVRFGMPLAVAGFASLFLNVGDRYLLRWLAGADEVAVYGWSAKFGGLLNMLFVQSFQMAFAVIALKKFTETRADPTFYRSAFRYYAIWTGWAVLGISLLAYDVTRWIAGHEAYLQIEVLVLPVTLGFLFYGLYYIVVNVLYAVEYTRVIPLLIAFAALVNVGLNLAFIPVWGAWGAAVATLLSYGVLLGLTARIAEQHLKVSYPWGKIAQVVFAIVLLYGLAHLSVNWPMLFRLLWRLSLMVVYPLWWWARGEASPKILQLWRKKAD